MKVLQLHTSAMVLTNFATTTLFCDGTFNQMWLDQPGDHPEFAAAAGYVTDWRRYIVEHDVLHNLVADERKQPWSWALHDGDGGLALTQAAARIREEEHIVQRLQRLMMLGQPDPWDVLPAVFGARLPALIRHAAAVLDSACGAIARPGLAR